jgi:hypothetical protein
MSARNTDTGEHTMANISITVTDEAGIVRYDNVHATRYTIASMIRKVRTQVAMGLRVPADSLKAEGFEIGNAANNARVAGPTWVEAPSASE